MKRFTTIVTRLLVLGLGVPPCLGAGFFDGFDTYGTGEILPSPWTHPGSVNFETTSGLGGNSAFSSPNAATPGHPNMMFTLRSDPMPAGSPFELSGKLLAPSSGVNPRAHIAVTPATHTAQPSNGGPNIDAIYLGLRRRSGFNVATLDSQAVNYNSDGTFQAVMGSRNDGVTPGGLTLNLDQWYDVGMVGTPSTDAGCEDTGNCYEISYQIKEITSSTWEVFDTQLTFAGFAPNIVALEGHGDGMIDDVSWAVPEPSMLTLLGPGSAGVLFGRRGRRHA